MAKIHIGQYLDLEVILRLMEAILMDAIKKPNPWEIQYLPSKMTGNVGHRKRVK